MKKAKRDEEKVKLAIRRKDQTPISEQLYSQLKSAILSGSLAPAQNLPSTRSLSRELGVARATVVECYRRLAAEGYLETKSAYQTLVSSKLPSSARTNGKPRKGSPAQKHALSKLARRLQKSDLKDGARTSAEISFATWRPSLDEAPLEDWARILWRNTREVDKGLLDFAPDRSGLVNLQNTLCHYLLETRQVACRPDQIIITLGFVQCLDIISRVHLDDDNPVAVEDPGFPEARKSLAAVGARVLPIAVDEDGLDVSLLTKQFAPAKLVLITPSHQYPTGAVLPLSRRLALLEWAGKTGACVIEDDYDSEYRYSGHVIPPLKALDKSGCVIYIGTFSKVLFPSVGVGYMVVPAHLAGVYANARRLVSDPVPVHLQATLSEFISEGHLKRHIRRMRDVYARRRALLVSVLKRQLKGAVEIRGENAGLHILVQLHSKLSDKELSKRFSESGVYVMSTKDLYSGQGKRGEFVLGYGDLGEEEIVEGVERISRALK